MSRARLDCPLCGAVAAAGDDIAPGRCPRCGARLEGGRDRPDEAVAAALAALGVTGLDAGSVTRGLFGVGPGHPADGRAAITSDRREGFYRWWVAVAADEDPTVLLGGLAGA